MIGNLDLIQLDTIVLKIKTKLFILTTVSSPCPSPVSPKISNLSFVSINPTFYFASFLKKFNNLNFPFLLGSKSPSTEI